MTQSRATTIYEALGDQLFRELAAAFYRRIDADPFLRPMFPPDLTEAEERQYLFLIQYFGGPTTYSDIHGHPRLRMRHFPFVIGREERDAWLGHMLAAIDEVGVPEPYAAAMRTYFENASLAMINQQQPERLR